MDGWVEATASTTRGRLLGWSNGGICLFRAVPYARPPIGPLRFRAPELVSPWSGVRDARAYGAAAPQNRRDALSHIFEDRSAGMSEDCLTLNLWTPGVDDARRPVLVWIHGGRFLRGSASESPFDGAQLARYGDVVVIAIQYRLGPLGFLHVNGGRPWVSNLGLRDQIAALEWVRDEVAGFGGDPQNVTLFGHSAGAISAGTLLCSPKAKGLFHRAILQSGPPVALEPAAAAPVAETLMRSLRITEPADLQHVPVEALLACEDECSASPGIRPLAMPYMPVIDGDVVTTDPFEALASGASSQVPLLVGTTRDEMSVYLLLDPETAGLGEDGLLWRCEGLLGGGDAGREAIEVYRCARSDRGESTEPRDLWFAILADRHVRHPSLRLAELNGRRESRTYAYRFDWASPFMEGALGACHSLDVPFVFGTLTDPQLAYFTGIDDRALALGDYVRDAWIQFARNGSPGQGWPTYEPTRRETMILDAEPRLECAPADPERRFWDQRPSA